LRVGGRRGDVEECAGYRDVLGAVGVGKEPVVADAMETLGEHVHQETPDGPLFAVTVAHSKLIKPAELRAADGVFWLH
jgi:hypothetical protein